MSTEKTKKWKLPIIKLPRGVIIAICILPAATTGLFYALRPASSVMGWAAAYISAPIRGFLGMLSSIYPFSVTEALLTIAVVWLVYYIIKTITMTVRRRGKMKILSKRLLPVIVAALYFWGAFCWLWNTGYHCPGFAEKNGFKGDGVHLQDLANVTRLFAENANELAPLVPRGDDGRYIGNRRNVFAASTSIYRNIASEFPDLSGRLYTPKSMMFSWLMSRTGYAGMYFALTGEANINTKMPGPLLPVTVAHEHAHQLGVFAEDEANFVGMVACIASGNIEFEYSGYLKGLMYLLPALSNADPEAWLEINASLSDGVKRDWQDNYNFWESQRSVDTGVAFFDKMFTTITLSVSDAVDAVYDGFLKSQNQELGLKSYGACVDLLVEYFVKCRV